MAPMDLPVVISKLLKACAISLTIRPWLSGNSPRDLLKRKGMKESFYKSQLWIIEWIISSFSIFYSFKNVLKWTKEINHLKQPEGTLLSNLLSPSLRQRKGLDWEMRSAWTVCWLLLLFCGIHSMPLLSHKIQQICFHSYCCLSCPIYCSKTKVLDILSRITKSSLQ